MVTTAVCTPSTPEGSRFPPLIELLSHVCLTLTVDLPEVKLQGPSIGLASALAVLSLLFRKPLFNRVVTGIVSVTLILRCLVKLYPLHKMSQIVL
jgi:hypothetical protein